MNELLTNLSSPSWWIGVVIVSFAINLASAYAKTPLDRALARFSTRRRKRFERTQLDHSAMLEAARRQKDGLVLLSIQELRLVIIGITVVVLCILLLLLLMLQSNPLNLAILFAVLIPLFLFVAFFCLRQATKISVVLKLNESSQSDNEA